MDLLSPQWQLKAEDEVRDENPSPLSFFSHGILTMSHRAKSNASSPKIAFVVFVPMNVSSAVSEH